MFNKIVPEEMGHTVKKVPTGTIEDPELSTIILEEMDQSGSDTPAEKMYQTKDISQEKIYKAMDKICQMGYTIKGVILGEEIFHLRIICI